MPHAKIGDLLQADDEVARWLVVLSLGRNDVALTKKRLEESFATGERTALHWSRLLAGHLFEIAKFLRRSSGGSQIREFTKTLPEDAQAAYKNLLGRDFLKKVLGSDRNLVFHYPSVDRRRSREGGQALAAALEKAKDLPMYFRPTYDENGGVSDLRFEFADQVAVQFAATNFGFTDDEHRQAAAQVKGYSEQLIGFADRAILVFMEQRGSEIGPPADPIELD